MFNCSTCIQKWKVVLFWFLNLPLHSPGYRIFLFSLQINKLLSFQASVEFISSIPVKGSCKKHPGRIDIRNNGINAFGCLSGVLWGSLVNKFIERISNFFTCHPGVDWYSSITNVSMAGSWPVDTLTSVVTWYSSFRKRHGWRWIHQIGGAQKSSVPMLLLFDCRTTAKVDVELQTIINSFRVRFYNSGVLS